MVNHGIINKAKELVHKTEGNVITEAVWLTTISAFCNPRYRNFFWSIWIEDIWRALRNEQYDHNRIEILKAILIFLRYGEFIYQRKDNFITQDFIDNFLIAAIDDNIENYQGDVRDWSNQIKTEFFP